MITAKYIIKNIGDVSAELWSESVYTEQTAWKNITQSQVIVKFPADTSADLSGETVYNGFGELWESLTPSEWREE